MAASICRIYAENRELSRTKNQEPEQKKSQKQQSHANAAHKANVTTKAEKCILRNNNTRDIHTNNTHTHTPNHTRRGVEEREFRGNAQVNVMNAFQDFELGAKLYLQCLCNSPTTIIPRESFQRRILFLAVAFKDKQKSKAFVFFSYNSSVAEQLPVRHAIVHISREPRRSLSVECHRPLAGERLHQS